MCILVLQSEAMSRVCVGALVEIRPIVSVNRMVAIALNAALCPSIPPLHHSVTMHKCSL